MLEEKLEEKNESWLRELKKAASKSLIYGSLVVALALGAAGCGKKSYCCEHMNCGSGYICEDMSIGSGMCIKDSRGNETECCLCVPYTPSATDPANCHNQWCK